LSNTSGTARHPGAHRRLQAQSRASATREALGGRRPLGNGLPASCVPAPRRQARRALRRV